MGSFYQESGKINFGATLLAIIGAVVVIFFIAYGYAFLTDLNPFIYINFLATLVYAVIVGVVLNFVKRIGKIRSFSTALILGVILSLFGLYAVWVTYISVVFEMEMLYGASHFSYGMDILANRSFSIGRAMRSSSLEFSGGMLYALWIVEALILVGGPVFFVFSQGKNDEVYCEDCEKWASDEQMYLKRRQQNLTQSEVQSLIHANSIQTLLDMDEAFEGDASYYEVRFTSCGNCKKAYYLSINYVQNRQNSKGETEKEEELIFPFYELDLHTVPREILNSPVS